MTWTISGAFLDREAAERAAADLRTAGFDAAQMTLVPLERPGATDAGQALRPSKRSISGGILGSLVLGAIGLIVGWAFALLMQSISHTGSISFAGPIVAAICGIVIGWLLGEIVWTHAPVEEGYAQQEHLEMGAMCLLVEAGDRADEVRQILRREGAHDVTPLKRDQEEHEGFEPGAPRGVAG